MYQYGFRKSFSSQYCLLAMLENGKGLTNMVSITNRSALQQSLLINNNFFRKNVKHFLSTILSDKDETHLTGNNELVKTDLETAKVGSYFFFNKVQNLETSRYLNIEPYVNCIKDPTLKVILKYRKRSDIAAIRNECKNKDSFETILKLGANKPS